MSTPPMISGRTWVRFGIGIFVLELGYLAFKVGVVYALGKLIFGAQ